MREPQFDPASHIARGGGGHRVVLLEQAFQLTILAQRGVRLIQCGIKAHYIPVHLLAQRINGHAALGVMERLADLTGALQMAQQLAQRVEERLLQRLPLGQNPIVIIAGQ